jgi:multiple sugar transport system permease protein
MPALHLHAVERANWGDVGKGLFFLSPWMFGYLVFTITPIIMTVYFSLSEYSVLEPPVYVGLQNYRDLLHDKWFGNAMLNTGAVRAMALPGAMAVSLGLALLLNQPIRGQVALSDDHLPPVARAR